MLLLGRFFLSFALLGVLLSPVIAHTVTIEFGLYCRDGVLKNGNTSVLVELFEKRYYGEDHISHTPGVINDEYAHDITGTASSNFYNNDFFLKFAHFCDSDECPGERWSYYGLEETVANRTYYLNCIDLSQKLNHESTHVAAVPFYKLHYLNSRGTGEMIRQTFVYAGIDFDDVRYPVEQFNAFRQKFPFGHVPVLEVDGKLIPQSGAIARYVARQFGLAGKTDLDAAWVDAILDKFKDYHAEIRGSFYAALGFKKGDKAATLREQGESARDKFFPLLETQLKKAGFGFLVGDSLTFVDFLIADQVDVLNLLFPGFLEAYPEMIEHSTKISALLQIKAWIEKRPKTRF